MLMCFDGDTEEACAVKLSAWCIIHFGCAATCSHNRSMHGRMQNLHIVVQHLSLGRRWQALSSKKERKTHERPARARARSLAARSRSRFRVQYRYIRSPRGFGNQKRAVSYVAHLQILTADRTHYHTM